MPKLSRVSGKEIVKVFSKLGFEHIRTHWSHAILSKIDNEKGKITVPVPLHNELAKGTLKSIMRQVGINLEELLELLWFTDSQLIFFFTFINSVCFNN